MVLNGAERHEDLGWTDVMDFQQLHWIIHKTVLFFFFSKFSHDCTNPTVWETVSLFFLSFDPDQINNMAQKIHFIWC